VSKQEEKTDDQSPKVGGAYAHYVLFVLIIVYVFNFIDRQILSILSEDIKRDLGVTDAQMGFLYGTVFAVFYAVFGIPLARFADVWVRRSLISIGLMFWSAMTALSGFAKSFPMLAALRIGVGIGEASASPAAYSMLSDYYSPKVRATVIAIYSSGVYIGSGIGLFLGGFIMETWNSSFTAGDAPMGLKGWQAAFLGVGMPGILMAIWVRTLKEPVRGISEDLIAEKHPKPFSVLATELAAMLPVVNLFGLKKVGASIWFNLMGALLITLVGFGLYVITDNLLQWLALGIGIYVVFSWAQSLKARDSATYHMIFKSKAMVFTMIAFPTISFVTYGVGFWTAPLLLRLHDVSATEVGMYIGLGNALGGLLGVTLGGMLGDRLKQKYPGGRLFVGVIAIFGTFPLMLWMVYTENLMMAFFLNFAHHIFSASWAGIAPATATDLVMPRMRAVAGAYYILINTMIGLAMGPYIMGELSDFFAAGGMDTANALRSAITSSMLIFFVTLLFLYLAWKNLPEDEATRLERAKKYGEEINEAS
tara:strand:+ start:426 stop:2030 length:1605 start_codon:yes stop_codon:yes gene_type:complete